MENLDSYEISTHLEGIDASLKSIAFVFKVINFFIFLWLIAIGFVALAVFLEEVPVL